MTDMDPQGGHAGAPPGPYGQPYGSPPGYPLQPPPVQPKSSGCGRMLLISAGAGTAVLLLLIAVGLAVGSGDDTERGEVTAEAAPEADDDDPAAAAPATTDPPAPTTTTTTVPIVEEGTYTVGPDPSSGALAPGLYRVSGYWARLDAAQEIIDNDIVDDNGFTLLNVQPTDAYVEISGAATALVHLPTLDPLAEGFTEGTYLVGTDIQPGRYNVEGEGAYFARLDAGGEIIDNNISDGNVIAIIQPGDWAFTYTGVITPMP